MSKLILRCVLLVSFSGIVSAQVVQDLALTKGAGYQIEWQKGVWGNVAFPVRSVLGTADGGVVVTGDLGPPGKQADMWIAKLDADGNVVWQKIFGGGAVDSSLTVKETSNGDFIVMGPSLSFSPPGASLVLRISSQGALVWQRKIDGGAGSPVLYDVVYSEDDQGFLLVGQKGLDVWLVKLDSAGETEWSKTYGTSHVEAGRKICNVKGAGFIIAGTTNFPDSSGDLLVFNVDPNGTILWQSGFAGTNFGLGNQQDAVYSIAQLSIGSGCVIAADTRRQSPAMFSDVVIRFNSDGTSPWRAYLGSPTESGSQGMSIAGTTDGGYLLGARSTSTSPASAWVVKGSPSGDVVSGCSAVQVDSNSYGPGAIDLTASSISVNNTPVVCDEAVGSGIIYDISLDTETLCEGAGAWSKLYNTPYHALAVQAISVTSDGGAVFAMDWGTSIARLLVKLTPARSVPEQFVYGGDPSDELAANLGISTGYFNKDGYPDLVLGAAGADGPNKSRANAGEVYVALGQGSPRDLDLERPGDAGVRYRGGSAGDALGFATATGNLNGDEYADLVFGAPGRDTGGGTDSGEVDVFFGSTPLVPDVDLASVSPDIRITGSVAGGAIGSSLALGDLNGDTVPDLAIGAPGTSASPGRVYVFYGPIAPGTYSTSSANVTVLGRDNGDALGTLVAIGNVNGTAGAQDLVASAVTADGIGNAKANAGEVYVLFGGSLPATYNLATTAPNYEIIGADAGDQIGSGLAVGGVSADAIADIAIGARFADGNSNARADAGEVFVKFGSTTLAGTLNLATSSANVRLIGGHAGDNLGTSVAIAEVNLQPPMDLIVGAPGVDITGTRADAGEVDVLLGPVSGAAVDMFLYRASLAFFGVDPSDRLGTLVAGGDLNGDGTADLLMAARGGDGPNDARSAAGEVYVVHGYCTPATAKCVTTDGTCTTYHVEMDSSCGLNCDACSADATTAILFSHGGAEGAYCSADEAQCTGNGTCDGDTDENGFLEGQFSFDSNCIDDIGAPAGFELLMKGGPLCPNRKLLLRLSGVQVVCE